MGGSRPADPHRARAEHAHGAAAHRRLPVEARHRSDAGADEALGRGRDLGSGHAPGGCLRRRARRNRDKLASFFTWFRLREDLENEERLARGATQYEDRELGAVRRAVSVMLPEVARMRVRRAPAGLVVQKRDAEFDVRQLAYGERP